MKCPVCGFENPEGRRHCGNCEYDLERTKAESPVRVLGIIIAIAGVVAGFVMIIIGASVWGGEFIFEGATPGNYIELGLILALSGAVIAIVSANALLLTKVRK